MLSTLVLLLITPLATLTTAAANNAGLPFEITNLSITKVRSANVTLTFTVHDPDPLTNATQLCTGTWPVGSAAYPTGAYVPCGNSTFAWRMESYASMANFVLDTEHAYEDPSVGQPPYDIIDNFAKANITPAVHPCRVKGGVKVCAQVEGAVIQAPVYATIA